MVVPPQRVPDGLSAREYSRLAAQYSLMGLEAQAMEAASRGQTDASAENDPASQEAFAAGQALANAFLQMLSQSPEEREANGSTALEQAMQQLKNLGVPDEELSKCMGMLSTIVNQSHEAPPAQVPTGLTAREYLELGVRYKDVGWTEQARDSLQLAIELDPEGVGQQALRYLRSKIPRYPVPFLAVQTNIAGFNEMAAGDSAAARETFENLIEQYPDFEWPMGNLGSLMLQWGNVEEAKNYLQKAVVINPYYLNGWLHLARAYAVESDLKSAYQCLDKASSIGSDDSAVAHVRQMVDLLKERM